VDRLKTQILHLLEENSTLPKETIATMLGASPEEVAAAIDELERQKVILRYSTVINWEKAGVDHLTAMIEVKVTPQRDSGFDALAERIYRFPEVRSVYLMSGAYDLSVIVEGKSIKEVARFVSEKLSTIEHVISTTTHFILKKYKQDGVIFEDHEDDQRLVISP
jgi:DNA-binding Lrp family transcriptional regulator